MVTMNVGNPGPMLSENGVMESAQGFGMADLFGGAMEAHGENAYGEWTRGIQAAQLLNMETMESFVESAELALEEQRFVEGLCGLGREQVDAACNNRLHLLLAMAGEVEHYRSLLEAEKEGRTYTLPMPDDLTTLDTHETLKLLLPSAGGGFGVQGVADIENKIVSVQHRIAITSEEIRRDIEAGFFQDFGNLKILYRQSDPYKELNGRKAQETAFFYKEAMGYCVTSMQGTRLDHAEALWSRMMRKLGGKNFEMRGMTNPSDRRRRRGGRRNRDDDDMED